MKFVSIVTIAAIALTVFAEADNFELDSDGLDERNDQLGDDAENVARAPNSYRNCNRYCKDAYDYGRKYEHRNNWKKYLCTNDFRGKLDRCKNGCDRKYYNQHWSRYIEPYYHKRCDRRT
ncbi:uncharacterized protein AC631_01886 [Debaryomyces fabryi]|uniref:Uncharacterized protein n=1 Tax=Debaryomyces fabryi TaxID=58627 RepID=A0A0V1Q1E0_9ASCO|nr:uncharacterized protein AC631_01886 [Debaryomyces fabryi]KSA02328.1 hypothetical protein AC631_01886 [Debaryomyces fabryi]CUM51497.1 unnamed protein product [Debaryomyces fabryi]